MLPPLTLTSAVQLRRAIDMPTRRTQDVIGMTVCALALGFLFGALLGPPAISAIVWVMG